MNDDYKQNWNEVEDEDDEFDTPPAKPIPTFSPTVSPNDDEEVETIDEDDDISSEPINLPEVDDDDDAPETVEVADITDNESFSYGHLLAGSPLRPSANGIFTSSPEPQATAPASDTDTGAALEQLSESQNEALDEQMRQCQLIIDNVNLILSKVCEDEAKTYNRIHVRKYTNVAEMQKIVFAKPKEVNGNPLKKIAIFGIVCLFVGIFFGVEANSYYNMMGGKVQSDLACAWSWLTVFDTMPVSIEPLNSSVFFTAFAIGFGILGIIGLFVYLDTEQKRLSRVGHEHGNARLGTKKDFKTFKTKFMDNSDNNMLFGVFDNQELGLSLNNKKVNRSANVLVIGGTGTGKTFKYIKPNILQENCSMIVTDPSGDIFRSFAPYLLAKGYNVYLFNASDFTLSNHYNPLLNVYDSNGNISETQVDILVDLYMKNAKTGKEAGGGDPFWDKSEKSFLTSLIYYVLENEEYKDKRCFSQILELVQKAKVDDDSDEESPLTQEMEAWFKKCGITEKDPTGGGRYKTRLYYDTFRIAPQKTANTILITTAVDLQIFATKEVSFITQESEYKEMNIDINKMATQQSYLFLGIPQSHQAYNFLIAMLYSQLYGRLYELGERKLRGKWHIGYTLGTPVFDYFDSKEEAQEFYESITLDDIVESDYINGTKIYNIMYKNKAYKTSVLREPLEKFINEIDKMYIWAGDDFAGGDPALPIHINFLLDEFKNIGEIPNFLTILSTSRKYRIGSHIVIQDIGQLKTMYKEGEHETVLANVDTTVFLGSILTDDKETVQKMLGKTTIRQKSTSSSNSGLSTSYTPTEVDLMSIDEISAINQNGRDDELVIIRDVTPYLCRKLNLTQHKRWGDVGALKKKYHLNLDDYYRNNRKEGIHKN